jgi:hypothetical protein
MPGSPDHELIDLLLAPYEEQLQQAESTPGWGARRPRPHRTMK